MKTAELVEQRGQLMADMKAADAADNQEGFDKLQGEVEALDKRLTRARQLDAMDAATPKADPKLRATVSNYSLARALQWAAGQHGVDAGLEKEMDAEIRRTSGRTFEGVAVPSEIFERRTISSTEPAGGPGGKLIGDDFRPDLYISALTDRTIVAGLGARTLSGLTGNVTIPGESAAPTTAWVAENSALSASDAKFRDVTLSPKHVGSLAGYSRNMLLQSSPDVEQLLRGMMARDIALEIDRAAINGGGANEPAGILSASGTSGVSYTTDLFTTAAAMIAKADELHVSPRHFLASGSIAKACRLALDANGRPYQLTDIFHGEAPTISGLVPEDLGIGSDEFGLIYADFSEMLIGVWSGLDVLVNPYESTAYSKGNVLVRAIATVDVALRHPAAFVKATGVKSTLDVFA